VSLLPIVLDDRIVGILKAVPLDSDAKTLFFLHRSCLKLTTDAVTVMFTEGSLLVVLP